MRNTAVMISSVSETVEPASPFADGIALQRGVRTPVRGRVKAGEKGTVAFAGVIS